MQENHPNSLSQYISIITDPRIDRTKEHSLHDILLISIPAMLCGAETFVDFRDFGTAKESWLRTFLRLPAGIPSHDTFGRVFALLDPQGVAGGFCNWTQSPAPEPRGRSWRSTARPCAAATTGPSANPPSTWSAPGRSENGLVLGQIRVDLKEQ